MKLKNRQFLSETVISNIAWEISRPQAQKRRMGCAFVPSFIKALNVEEKEGGEIYIVYGNNK